jgi:hypothetical protein
LVRALAHKPSNGGWKIGRYSEALLPQKHHTLPIKMENLSLDDDADQSLVSENTSTTSKSFKSRGKSAHETWRHSRSPLSNELTNDPNNNRPLMYCKHCTTSKTYSSFVTGNFRNHLQKTHGIIVMKVQSSLKVEILQQVEALWAQADGLGRTEELDAYVLDKYLDQKVIDEALISFSVLCCCSYSSSCSSHKLHRNELAKEVG